MSVSFWAHMLPCHNLCPRGWNLRLVPLALIKSCCICLIEFSQLCLETNVWWYFSRFYKTQPTANSETKVLTRSPKPPLRGVRNSYYPQDLNVNLRTFFLQPPGQKWCSFLDLWSQNLTCPIHLKCSINEIFGKCKSDCLIRLLSEESPLPSLKRWASLESQLRPCVIWPSPLSPASVPTTFSLTFFQS